MTQDARSLVTTYFQSWKDRDFAALRSVLAGAATFRGPLGTADGAEQCITGLAGLAEIMTGIVIRVMVVDGPDVMTWYDMHTSVAPPCPTVNWSRVEDGKITAIRALFDPRDLLAGMAR